MPAASPSLPFPPRSPWLPLVFLAAAGLLALLSFAPPDAIAADADFDGDGIVEFRDFVAFAAAFGTTDARFDLDEDGVVGFGDFVVFANAYNSGLTGRAILKTLRPGHPRLLLTDAGLDSLRERWQTDPTLKKVVSDVLGRAAGDLGRAPLRYELIGPRLLSVSRECLRRVVNLALAWRWTGDPRYLREAADNLLTVSRFPDWNPSHFLDVAEMTHALGIGYDWLYHGLSSGERETIRGALIRHGLQPGVDAYNGRGPSTWWPRSDFNWNQVCNGGLAVGALALADRDPQYAEAILPKAVASLPLALASYAPDGAWGEGPGYWDYATRYTAFGISAMQTALGRDFGLTHREGLEYAARFPIYAAGPAGYYLNYADSGEKARRRPMPCSFWLARQYGDAFTATAEHALLKSQRAEAHHLVWYVPPPDGAEPPQLDRLFRGVVPVALFRSSWADSGALFAGIKAGYNQVNHGHLDLGGFEFDALGVRWARDLGSDNYDLPGYFESRPDGRRWAYYRLNSLSHSVPLLDGNGQDPAGTSSLVRFRAGDPFPFAQVDLSDTYADGGRVVRGLALVNGRQDLLIQDEFRLRQRRFVTWAMTTDAAIQLVSETEALLSLGGRRLRAFLLSPSWGVFSFESAEQPSPEKPNTGVRRLLVSTHMVSDVTVTVLLAPEWTPGRVPPVPVVGSVDAW